MGDLTNGVTVVPGSGRSNAYMGDKVITMDGTPIAFWASNQTLYPNSRGGGTVGEAGGIDLTKGPPGIGSVWEEYFLKDGGYYLAYDTGETHLYEPPAVVPTANEVLPEVNLEFQDTWSGYGVNAAKTSQVQPDSYLRQIETDKRRKNERYPWLGLPLSSL